MYTHKNEDTKVQRNPIFHCKDLAISTDFQVIEEASIETPLSYL
jgi:hypothetical protein